MESAGSITAKLHGGYFDGDTVRLAPAGSIAPPSALEYFGSNGQGKPGFHRYEMANVFKYPVWPDNPVSEIYNYTGFKAL